MVRLARELMPCVVGLQVWAWTGCDDCFSVDFAQQTSCLRWAWWEKAAVMPAVDASDSINQSAIEDCRRVDVCFVSQSVARNIYRLLALVCNCLATNTYRTTMKQGTG